MTSPLIIVFPSPRSNEVHDHDVRDVQQCFNEPHLQPLSGEALHFKTVTNARLHIAANGFWGAMRGRSNVSMSNVCTRLNMATLFYYNQRSGWCCQLSLAVLLTEKLDLSYGKVMGWIRCKLRLLCVHLWCSFMMSRLLKPTFSQVIVVSLLNPLLFFVII